MNTSSSQKAQATIENANSKSMQGVVQNIGQNFASSPQEVSRALFYGVSQELLLNKTLVQITIIEHNGSTPRTAGTKMLVRHDGSILGTVGGGLYEAKAIRQAKSMLDEQTKQVEAKSSEKSQTHSEKNQEDSSAFILYFNMQVKQNTTDMDMICGGDLRLLVELISPTQENKELYAELCACQQSVATFVTRITPSLDDISQVSMPKLSGQIEENSDFSCKKVFVTHALLRENYAPINGDILSESLRLELEKDLTKERKNIFLQNHEFCFHALNKPYRLHIFGAGHVSFELAKITHYLGFTTYVLDDRSDFANAERFGAVHSLVLPSLDEENVHAYLEQYTIDEQDGLIIVTRGHARDRDVLMSCMKTHAGYLGMIGSRSKRQATYEYLLNNGYKKEDFDRIYSPIGLSIGAQSPQEIAISISAQLIQWRASCLGSDARYA